MGRTESKIRIRPMRAEDIPAVAALEKASFSRPWSEADLQETMAAENLFLCLVLTAPPEEEQAGEEEETVLGFLISEIILDTAELDRVAVREDARGQGYGRALLTEFLFRARERGARTVVLEVRESNEAARCLYADAGFKEIGRRKHYYEKPAEDALVMQKGPD